MADVGCEPYLDSVSHSERSPARRRAKRALIAGAIALPILGVVLWGLVHQVEWLGPSIANGLRRVIGTESVGKLEEWAYGVDDRLQRLSRGSQTSVQRWEVPETATVPKQADAGAPRFSPRSVGPVFARPSAPGDGAWVPVELHGVPSGEPLLYKTLLHPDKNRPWAEAFVVAIDASRTEVWATPGTQDPEATAPAARHAPRPALVPEDKRGRLVAVFNGGFKTEHGGYGMKADGVTFIPPRADLCTFAGLEDGTLRVEPWKKLADLEPRMRWLRQTPRCMVEQGKLHPGLLDPEVKSWGAMLGGDVVIRRSAVGLSADRKTLFVSVTNYTTPHALGLALQHVGAVNVAQLDINWSYPRFVVFEPGSSGELRAVSLFEGFEFKADLYTRRAALKDFFYVLRR